MTKQLKAALKKQKKSTKREILQITGTLGIPINGNRTVEVPNRNSFVYVKLRDNQSEVIQAFNNKVAPSYGLPVIVERQSNRYIVVNVDTVRYQNNWNSFSPFLPRHGNTHSMDFESGGGGDIVWVHSRQFMPALIMPSGSDGGPNVIMNAYSIKNTDGTWKYVGVTGTPNFTPWNPSTGTQAIMALVYLDSLSGNPYFMVGTGSFFPESITGTAQILPYVPSLTNPNHIPLAAVRLVTGTSQISWDNIYDVRQFLHVIPTGTGGGTNTIAVWDEGISLGTVGTLNFVGNGVDVSISGSVARVHISGSSGGGIANLTGTSIGQPSAVVMTSVTGTLVAQPWLQWRMNGANPYIKFGANVAGQDGFAGLIGYKTFNDNYLEIVGAGSGTNSRNVRIFDNLSVSFINQGQYLKNTSFDTAWPFVDNTGLYVGPTNAPTSTAITGSSYFLGLDTSNVSVRYPTSLVREKLTTTRTYYVRTDGSDSNSGLVNTSSGAFLTIQKAIDVASALDNGGFNITINVADGTYAAANTLKSFIGSGTISIIGNTTTPANVILNTGISFTASGVLGTYIIRGIKFSGVSGIFSQNKSVVQFGNIDFATSSNNLYADSSGSIKAIANYTISASTNIHVQASRLGYIDISAVTITLSGTPAWSAAMAYADLLGMLDAYSITFSGSATGKRYFADSNSVLFTNGGGANYFPGNVAGSTSNQGLYL